LPGTSARTIDLPDQQSSIGAQHSGKENEDQKEPRNLIYLWVANYVEFRHFAIIIRLEEKGKGKNSNTMHAKSRNS
jgi:hypothetical protein